MRKICIINQKGGVGKTTTAISLAAGLARQDKKVLVIDLDAQGNVATSLNAASEKDIFHLLTENAEVAECITNLGKNLDIIPSNESLTKAEAIIAKMPNKEFLLKKKLGKVNSYDYVLIDCPPSLGILNQNAMLYAQEAFIPVSTEHLGYDALIKMTEVIKALNSYFDHDIKITKVIPTMFDKRNKTCKEYLEKINNNFYEVVSDPIRINSKLKEAPAHGKSIFSYAASSRGAKDYMKVVKVVLSEEQQILASYPAQNKEKAEA